MSKFKEVLVGSALTIGTISGGEIVNAQSVGDGNADILAEISEADRRQAALNGSVICGIDASLTVQLGREDGEVVTDVQKSLSDLGYSFGPNDGVLGPRTCASVIEFQSEKNLYVDGLVGPATYRHLRRSSSSSQNIISQEDPSSRRTITPEVNYSLSDCQSYEKWSNTTIEDVQRALGVVVDGEFGPQTCNAMINHQEKNGIAQYGKGFLGPRTLGSLGINRPELKQASTVTSNGTFVPEKDCPTASACTIEVDKTNQHASVLNRAGDLLWRIPVQTGRAGFETRNGNKRLGQVEYGPNGNPERFSTDYPEAILVNFRRVDGGQGFHGSYGFGYGSGSAGCIRMENDKSYIMAQMPSGTPVNISGIKPGTNK